MLFILRNIKQMYNQYNLNQYNKKPKAYEIRTLVDNMSP